MRTLARNLTSVGILLVCSALPSWADFDAGVAASKSGDYAAALKEWRPLAEQGHANAQFNLGVMYENGWGVPEDHAEAVRWYRPAAEQGHTKAQFNLGVMYDRGQGVPQDYAEARRWYHLAAEKGHALAQAKLGFLYETGHGVLQDYVQAYMWYNLAGKLGFKEASEWRNRTANKMTPAQIAEAKKLAREWKPKK